MSDKLSEEIINQLDAEAKAEAKKLTARVPIFRMGYESGWYDGAEKYLARAERYEKALIKIVSLSCRVGNRNAILELKSIASMAVAKEQDTLTPKQGSDE